MTAKQLAQVEQNIVQGPIGLFTDAKLAGLPDPVQRYFRTAIEPDAPLASTARIRMRGSIKVKRWLPFRARQVLNPHLGYVWAARVAWLIAGADYYYGGEGGMEWRLAGFRQLVREEGPDVSLAAMGRGAAEAIWIPTALLPCYGVEWVADDERRIRASWTIDGRPFNVRYHLGDDGRIRSVLFERWGDPDETGTWSMHPFGGDMTGYDTFEGVTIPSAGRIGWHYGTDRWADGEFFRYNITDLTLFTDPRA